MKFRLLLVFSLCILITGCETTSPYTDGHSAFEQKLTQIDLEMLTSMVLTSEVLTSLVQTSLVQTSIMFFGQMWIFS